jgi:non-ribosomal peptide synthetase component F
VPSPVAVRLDRRSNRLARGLVSLGVGPGDRVALLCCEDHSDDRLVAELAAGKLEAGQICIPLDLDVVELRDRLLGLRPTVVLACREGVAAWRATGVACRVVGDETGVIWWKLLELRHSPGPLSGPGASLDLVS